MIYSMSDRPCQQALAVYLGDAVLQGGRSPTKSYGDCPNMTIAVYWDVKQHQNKQKGKKRGAVAWWLTPWTPDQEDPEVRGSSPTRVAVLCP